MKKVYSVCDPCPGLIDGCGNSFGGFLAVLIAVKNFINIRRYLGTNIFPVQLVVSTTLALGVTYWLLRQGQHYERWDD